MSDVECSGRVQRYPGLFDVYRSLIVTVLNCSTRCIDLRAAWWRSDLATLSHPHAPSRAHPPLMATQLELKLLAAANAAVQQATQCGNHYVFTVHRNDLINAWR